MARELKNSSDQKPRPPVWAIKCFRWYCNDYLSEAVLGDLEEIHERRCLSIGKRRADLLFLWNAIQFIQPFALKPRNKYSSSNSLGMAHNSAKIAWRTMSKQKLFIAINIMGMSIAVACCIITWGTYEFNEQFDHYNKDATTAYRINSVRQFQNEVTEFGHMPVPLIEAVRQNAGDVKLVTRYIPTSADIRIGDEIYATGFSFVDPDFFRVFTFEFLEGDAASLSDKSKILISDVQAKKFFGAGPVVGKTVTQILPGNKLHEFSIGGVFKTPPANSSFNDDIFVHFENQFDDHPEMQKGNNWSDRATLFVTLNNPARIQAVEEQLIPFAKANNQVRQDFMIKNFKLDPFVGMALRDRDMDRQGTWTRPVISFATVFASAVMSMLVLLIACFNLTNTAISISSRRLKEIGIRKVMGSLRTPLILQFMGETMMICFVSLAVGIILSETFLLPEFNKLWPYMKLEIHYFESPTFLLFMGGVLLLTGLVAGSYPAFYITQFQPNEILKGKLTIGGASVFSNTLLTLQYAISLIAIVNSFAFVNNAWYQRHYDLGFEHSGVIFTKIKDGNEYEVFKNALSNKPGILSIAGSTHHLNSDSYKVSIKNEGQEFETDAMNVGDDYVKTMRLRIIEGRDFHKASEIDFAKSAIITKKLAAKFGWTEPLGKEITLHDTVRLQVIAVIQDPLNLGLWQESQPLLLRLTPVKNYKNIVVSATPASIIEVNSMMEKKWKELFPNQIYHAHYMDDEMVEAVSINDNLVKSFGFLGFVTIILSATGLFTLVSLNVLKKMKEIGIRKVYGASAGNIARIINMKFIIMLGIASIIGAFGGVSFSTLLMKTIWHYYDPISFGMLSFAILLLFFISILTIGYKVYTTSKINPIATLKEE